MKLEVVHKQVEGYMTECARFDASIALHWKSWINESLNREAAKYYTTVGPPLADLRSFWSPKMSLVPNPRFPQLLILWIRLAFKDNNRKVANTNTSDPHFKWCLEAAGYTGQRLWGGKCKYKSNIFDSHYTWSLEMAGCKGQRYEGGKYKYKYLWPTFHPVFWSSCSGQQSEGGTTWLPVCPHRPHWMHTLIWGTSHRHNHHDLW